MPRFTFASAIVLFLNAACGGPGPGIADMTVPVPVPDQGVEILPAPKLQIPPYCPISGTVSVVTLYYSVVNNPHRGGGSCTVATACHAPGGQAPTFGPDPTGFRNAVVDVSAARDQQPTLMYIKPKDPDNSFLLYKILGQQDKIQAGKAPMPFQLPPLDGVDKCLFINWVRTGAN